uniref:Chloride channel accessory 4 n=1 Tax=Mustela putorius furo TaxID=9669 RepID=M3Y174_MUSPF
MGFLSFVFLLVLYLLQESNTSLIQLSNNGYEGIIFATDPRVLEDGKIIEQIKFSKTTPKNLISKVSSNYSISRNKEIGVPVTYKDTEQYKRPKHESYKHADVLVAPPTFPGRDEPYTYFTACEEKGEYIHFTPDFILGKKQDEYGPSGRNLTVHEWAHLHWGLFDEYNEEAPFYSAKSKKNRSNKCSTGITGINRVYKCQGNRCTIRACRIDSETKLYEKDCQFFPDKEQTEKATIMFMRDINSVVEFCNKENHSRGAPSLQNKMCNSRSTWEVISNCEDFKNTTSLVAPPPLPVFSLLKIRERIVCLVLDKSGSMSGFNRLNQMNQATKHFLLQTIENGSWVGMVHFDSTTNIKRNLIQIISSKERNNFLESLTTEANGGTSICAGIRSTFQVIREVYPQINGSEIVLLTDGEDNSAKNCIDEVKQSEAIIHLIALGPSADQAIIEMSAITGGNHFCASDEAQNNSLIDAFGALASGNTDLSQQPLQLESMGLTLNNNPWMNGTVIIDSTVGKDTFLTWTRQAPVISLWDPNGTPMRNFTGDAVKMAYLSIPGIAEVGVWTYSLQPKAYPETLNSQAANSSVPPITVNAKMNKDTNSFPSPVIVYAEVLQGNVPVLRANVTASIESNNGKTEVLELLDNGAECTDSFKNYGVYSRYFIAYSENGRYNFKVRAHRGTNVAAQYLRHPLTRAAHIPGWVVDGKIEGNPPRVEIDEDTQTALESFTRTASGGAFVIANVSKLPLPDLYPPSQIMDIEATFEGDGISLTWTALGDNFDVGKAEQCIIKISGRILDLRDNFDNALQVSITDLLPNEANSKETFTFKPGNISEENTTHIFIPIQSVDKSNLRSKLSNIAQVALLIPQAEPGPDESHPNSGISISSLVLLVVGSVAVVSFILSATICIIHKKKISRRPRTGF